jgi:hypothetical protein
VAPPVSDEPPELPDATASPSPPPPDAGAPDGSEDREALPVETAATEDGDAQHRESEPEPQGQEPEEAEDANACTAIESLMSDGELLASARSELSGEVRKGFSTVFVTAPEDQVAIARFFGEELVLVPRAAMDPEAADPTWFRVSDGPTARIERVQGRPPLARYRQYRDLFDYEYARLPESLRDLRRSVLLRSEVYLFAALIPPRRVGRGHRTAARSAGARGTRGRRRPPVRRSL